jgi:hypothetical protein
VTDYILLCVCVILTIVTVAVVFGGGVLFLMLFQTWDTERLTKKERQARAQEEADKIDRYETWKAQEASPDQPGTP